MLLKALFDSRITKSAHEFCQRLMLRPCTVHRLAQASGHLIKAIPKTLKSTPPIMSSSRPNGLIAKGGIELLTFGTPNGHKASIMLEELKEAYGKPDYTFQSINITESTQPSAMISALISHPHDLANNTPHRHPKRTLVHRPLPQRPHPRNSRPRPQQLPCNGRPSNPAVPRPTLRSRA